MRLFFVAFCLLALAATASAFLQAGPGAQMRSFALSAKASKASSNGEIVGNTKLSSALAQRLQISAAKATDALNFLIDTMKAEVRNGNKVRLHQFGTFSQVATPARNFRNPRTGAIVPKPASTKLVFKASSVAKAEVSGKSPAKAKPKTTAKRR